MRRLQSIAFAFAAAVLALAVAGCRSQRSASSDGGTAASMVDNEAFVARTKAANERGAACLTAKMKVKLAVGGQDLSLSGSLRMKRGEVVRLQLVALGFVEAARIELTPDYLMVMDRINRQYVRVRYDEVDFLRDAGIGFAAFEALFWDELFCPGTDSLTDSDFDKYTAYEAGTDVALLMERGGIAYRWMADGRDAHIKTANVRYRDTKRGDTQLTWHYDEFQPIDGGATFPTQSKITVATPRHSLKLDMTLGSISHDSSWETTTTPSSRYREVKIDEVLDMIKNL